MLEHPGWVFLFGALWGVMRFAYGDIGDDAMITFTYARNLVAGNGFVFNPGEYVYGTTAPVWGLFVALGMKLGCAPWNWAVGWDVVFGMVVMWRVREIMRAAGIGEFFPLTGTLIVVASDLTMHLAGMETGLYDVFIFSALSALARRASPWRATLWGSLAAALRPDGAAILAVALWYLIRHAQESPQRRSFVPALAPLLIPAAHAALAWWYFGSPVPQSVVAKHLITEYAPSRYWFSHELVKILFWNHQLPNLPAMIAVIGLIVGAASRVFRPVSVFAAVYVALFTFGHAPSFPWYYTPLFILGCMCVPLGALWMARGGERSHRAAWGLAYVLIAIVPQLRGTLQLDAEAAVDMHLVVRHRQYQAVASMIRHSTEGVPRVAATEIGYLGYFLDGHVFDVYGLVTPQAIQTKREGLDPLVRENIGWYVVPVQDLDPGEVEAQAFERPKAAGFTKHSAWRWAGGMTYVFRRSAAGS